MTSHTWHDGPHVSSMFRVNGGWKPQMLSIDSSLHAP